MTISVRALKAHPSKYLHRVNAGETIEVTSRGKVIARMTPPTAAAETVLGRPQSARCDRADVSAGDLAPKLPLAPRGDGPGFVGPLLWDRE